jgi:hypothetical protein
VSIDDIPRRAKLWLHCPAELALREVVDLVEQMGCDPRLTDVINAVHAAREMLADFVDDTNWRPWEEKIEPLAVCGKKCDHGSECLGLIGHEPPDRHETQHGCVFYDEKAGGK